ncbi:cytochrome c oxidase assembly protein subunit 15 [Maritimibacter alkaliphilus HTCC2654]|uniref:Heme A synthase n=1 Tax=Maritimibacter alkaliphilus HTCC2654 TaxID=314271 RepID=A3VJJ1_9RHOB|nr:heme A synthase [Maritimibacter alkaliphilus]EAQ11568.1 cytochrome c oxidase assembly protein [Rhodobacterales bacterium HTCC2654] [Maritimibacter alkaliphilus HTCC2654]TYP81385.1 cytochrome c oxidase assembly protein subunit 15 [Maritimibacter alkaliphilus HTCC2654]
MAQPGRSIFEEVGQDTPTRQTAQTGMIERGGGRGARRGIRAWLIALFALITVMVLVGGMTRLTDSGLSITEWNLVGGSLPPTSGEVWASEFEKYQQSPQYRLMNEGMSLSEFKSIYWWEWGHRQLGRFIGLVWIAGFLFFALTKRVPGGWNGRLLTIGVMIGVQGAVGWWMVHSGLQGEMTSVASYRLATHLGLAFAILALILWCILLLGRSEAEVMQARRLREKSLFGMGTGLMHLAFLQILLGALVAGIDAGRSFVDWPMMAGQFFPPDAFSIEPVWRNLFENPGLVQFMHRIVGYLLVLFAIGAFFRGRKAAAPSTRNAFMLASGMILVQMVIGIVTVLNASPLHIAIVHQAGAILTFSLIVTARYRAGYPKAQSVRG